MNFFGELQWQRNDLSPKTIAPLQQQGFDFCLILFSFVFFLPSLPLTAIREIPIPLFLNDLYDFRSLHICLRHKGSPEPKKPDTEAAAAFSSLKQSFWSTLDYEQFTETFGEQVPPSLIKSLG